MGKYDTPDWRLASIKHLGSYNNTINEAVEEIDETKRKAFLDLKATTTQITSLLHQRQINMAKSARIPMYKQFKKLVDDLDKEETEALDHQIESIEKAFDNIFRIDYL
jgi:hypothetical protein